MSKKKSNKYSTENENIKDVRINFEIENLTILDAICTYKGIGRHEFINNLLNREFADMKDKNITELVKEIAKYDL